MVYQSNVSLSQIQSEFDRGLAVAMDPVNDAAIQKGGKAATTLSSSWLHQVCSVCKHTFRLGDEVEINIDGKVVHNSALLPCAQQDVASTQATSEVADFFSGLDKAWPPPLNMPVRRLDMTSDIGRNLLAAPIGVFRRSRCAVCSHTLRLHDHVVICPCSPHQPLCQTAVHRDLIHGLHCLDAWNPSANGQSYCPITSRKLNS